MNFAESSQEVKRHEREAAMSAGGRQTPWRISLKTGNTRAAL